MKKTLVSIEQEISSEYSEYLGIQEFAAKHEKFLAEYETCCRIEAAKAEIPVVDVLNSLSADEQKEFLETIKAVMQRLRLE